MPPDTAKCGCEEEEGGVLLSPCSMTLRLSGVTLMSQLFLSTTRLMTATGTCHRAWEHDSERGNEVCGGTTHYCT